MLDASATKDILVRIGAGQTKHLTVRQLWAQEAINKMGIKVVKHPRELNCAGLLATCNSGKDIECHLQFINFGFWQ